MEILYCLIALVFQEKDFEYVIELGKQNKPIKNATIIYKNGSGTIYEINERN